MNPFKMGIKCCLAVLCAVCLFSSGRLFAQASPGPLPPSQPLPPPPQQPAPAPKKAPVVEPRKSIGGFWMLNTDESDDPRSKLGEARRSGGGSGGGMGGPGGRVGIGFPFPGGGGNGPYGGAGGGRGMGGEDGDNGERTLDVIRPANSLTIDLKDPEVDLMNERGDKLVIYTDGRKIQKSKENPVQTVSARWNGSQLVTDEKGPQGRKMSRTLELSADGKQFYETWRIERNRSETPILVRYVYDAAMLPRP